MNDREMLRIRDSLANSHDALTATKAAFSESFALNPIQAFEWKTAEVLLAQSRYEVARQISIDDVNTDEEFVASLDAWVSRIERRIDGLVRTESRSTSAMTNLAEDARNQATLEMYGRILEARKS